MILWGQDSPAIGTFLRDRLLGAAVETGTFMAVARGETIIAAVLFHNYQPEYGTIEMTAAADNPRWLTRQAIRAMDRYVFGQLGCQAVLMRSDTDNEQIAHIGRFLGFKRYDIPRIRGRDKGEAVYILAEEDRILKG